MTDERKKAASTTEEQHDIIIAHGPNGSLVCLPLWAQDQLKYTSGTEFTIAEPIEGVHGLTIHVLIVSLMKKVLYPYPSTWDGHSVYIFGHCLEANSWVRGEYSFKTRKGYFDYLYGVEAKQLLGFHSGLTPISE